jgi:hypothetical protein
MEAPDEPFEVFTPAGQPDKKLIALLGYGRCRRCQPYHFRQAAPVI